MPRRTNDFQRAIFAVQAHLAAGARVEESEELVDRVTGEPREVDVCVHGTVASHKVIVGLECRDWKSKQTVEWVDAMSGKHEHLPTDSLVLVSGSGFTRSALEKAEKLGIHTVSPGEDFEALGVDVAGKLQQMVFKAVTVRADGLRAYVDHADGQPPVPTRLFEDTYLYGAEGDLRATAKEFALAVSQRKDLFKDSLREATGEEDRFTIGIELGDDENQLYVRWEESNPPVLRHVVKFEVLGVAHVEVMPYELRHGAFDGTHFAYGGGTSEHFEISFSVTAPDFDNPEKSGSRTLHLKRTKMPIGFDEDPPGPVHAGP